MNNPQNPQLNISAISGSKLEQISKMKKLIEQGKIYFDKEQQDNTTALIMGVDFGSGKDYSIEHLFITTNGSHIPEGGDFETQNF